MTNPKLETRKAANLAYTEHKGPYDKKKEVGVVQAASGIQWLLNEFYGFFPCYRYHGLRCDQVTKS